MQCEYNGKTYTVEQDEAGTWYVTVGGTAVTSFKAAAGDTDDAVCARLRQWLSEHPEMGAREDIHLGGG